MLESMRIQLDQSGKVIVKFFWLTSIIISIVLTVMLNLIF